MNKKILFTILTLVVLSFISLDANAQCAMCKAVAESATDAHGNHSAGGINTGIIYMMGIPYFLLIILALVFFRERIASFLKEFRSIHS
jgi:hypothetical protein